MIPKIIIFLGALFGMYWINKNTKGILSVITLVMILGILAVLMDTGDSITIGIYIYLVGTAMAFLYGCLGRGRAVWPCLVIALMSGGMGLYWIWMLNHWHGNSLIAPVLVLVVGVAALVTRARVRNELGILVILSADALAVLVEAILK